MATSSRGKRRVARSAYKTERMEVRLAAAAKQVIQGAMAVTGLS